MTLLPKRNQAIDAVMRLGVQLGQYKLELDVLDDFDGTGAHLWAGGVLLAGWMAEQKPAFLGVSKVLELCCGVAALPSAVAALLGAKEVVASDGSTSVVETARNNMILNSVSVDVQEFDFHAVVHEGGAAASQKASANLILFADAIYTAGSSKLATCIDALLLPDGEVIGVLCGLHCGFQEFLEEMRLLHFVARILHCSPDLLDSIDSGKVTFAEAHWSGRLDLLGDLPISSRILVSWQRSDESNRKVDESPSVLAYLNSIGPRESDSKPLSAEELALRKPSVRTGVW